MALRRLHEPPSRTGASAYSSLCTVIRAAPLAVLFSVIGHDENFQTTINAFENGNLNDVPWSVVIKELLTLSVISVVWHRYVLDNNFVAWKLTAIDTLVPFVFALLQCFLALTVTSTSKLPTSFAFWIFSLNLMGIGAYGQIIPRFGRPHARLLYQEHYEEEGDKIYDAMLKYFSDSFWTLIYTSVASFTCLILVASNLFSPSMSLFLVTMTTLGIVAWLYFDDSHSRLEDWFMRGPKAEGETRLLPHSSSGKRQRSAVER
jgi:hypothetical protein